MPHSVIVDERCQTCKGQKEVSVATAVSQGGSLVIGHLMRLAQTSRVKKLKTLHHFVTRCVQIVKSISSHQT